MIDQTKLTMGLTVEELEKLEAQALHNQFCEALSALRDKFDNSPNQDRERQVPDDVAVICFE
jgi:hypothetical protein